MRFIDLDRAATDPAVQPLIAAADAALIAILAAPDQPTRKVLVEAHRTEWVAFRQHFERIFGAKCWYTECENPGTDDDVDHFRPKGRLAEVTAHGGYWWEALNWRNFRLSCHRTNRLRGNPETLATHGKGDHFPLLREEDRCWQPTDDLCRERPALLDPTDPADPPLLTFDPDGTTTLSPLYAGDANAQSRVDQSRLFLHLDWPRFKEDRQRLYQMIFTRVIDGDRATDRLDRGEVGARDTLKSVARDLIRYAERSSPYSLAAQSYVHLFRDRMWVRQFVLPHIPTQPLS